MSTQVDFAQLGICVYAYENKEFVPDGSKGTKYTLCKFGDDADMKKAEGVLHKYADIFLPFTNFEGMPTTINKKWTIVNNHRDDLMKMSNGDISVELWKHISDDAYYQNLGARISKIMGGHDWEQNFGESMVKKRKEINKELEEKREEFEKIQDEAHQLGTPKKGNISKRQRVR